MTIVAEADGNVVAVCYCGQVASPANRFLAVRRRGADRRAGAFVNAAGMELARWQPAGGGTAVQFAAAVGDPFLRMGLLSAVLLDD